MPTLHTIGFTQKTAEQFFDLLKANGVTLLADTRLNKRSQLSGFAKVPDLPYFLSLHHIGYLDALDLAPGQNMLDDYRSSKDWETYSKAYIRLIKKRQVEKWITADLLHHEKMVLMCSEPTAQQCHRRLAAEYLAGIYADLKVVHL
jgi:uncharacterized protein (DUF488 family)